MHNPVVALARRFVFAGAHPFCRQSHSFPWLWLRHLPVDPAINLPVRQIGTTPMGRKMAPESFLSKAEAYARVGIPCKWKPAATQDAGGV